MPGVVRDDEREPVAAVADLVLAAALRRVRDLEHEVGLETVPDVHLAVPPNRAASLRVGIRRPARVAPLDELAVRSLLRLRQTHDPSRRIRLVQHDVSVADEPQVVLDALVLVRGEREPARVRRRRRRVLAGKVGEVELEVEARAVLARANRLRVPVIAHHADDPLLAVRSVVGLGVTTQRAVVRVLRVRDGHGRVERVASEHRLFERRREAREVVLVLVDGPRHRLANRREVVVGGVRPPPAVVVAARVQIEVVVHGVHGDAQVVVAVVGLDVVVRELLRLHHGRHAEPAAPGVDLAVLVRPRLIKRVLGVRQVRELVLVRADPTRVGERRRVIVSFVVVVA